MFRQIHNEHEEDELWQVGASEQSAGDDRLTPLPAVMIPLGGTAQDVMLQFYKSLARAGMVKDGQIYTRVIDPDSKQFGEFAVGDTYELGANLASMYKRMGDDESYYRDLRDRIGDPRVHLRWLGTTGKLGEGSEKKPPNATAMLDYHYKQHGQKLSDWLIDPFKRLKDAAQGRVMAGNGETDKLDSRPVMSWILASLFGGTGNGLHLPLAQRLAHDLSEDTNLPYRVNFIALAPGVAEKLPEQNTIKALAAARIGDWDAHVKKDDLPPLKIGGVEVERGRWPFHQVFLLDNKSEYGDYEAQAVLERAALGLRLMTDGVTGRQYVSDSQNALGELQQFPYFLSTYNAYEIVIRPDELQLLFALMSGPAVTKEHLSEKFTGEQAQKKAQEAVKALLTKEKINRESLNQLFAVPPISLNPIAKLRGAALRKELPALFVKEYPLREKVLAKNLTEQMGRFREAVGQQLTDILNMHGLPQARVFVQKLAVKLEEMRSEQNKEVANINKQLAEHRRKLEPDKRKWKRLLIFTRDKLLASQADQRWSKLMSKDFSLQLLLLKQAKPIEFFEATTAEVETWGQRLDNTVAKFDNLAKTLKQDEETYRGTREAQRPSCEESLLTVEDEKRLYKASQGKAVRQLVQGISYRWVAESCTMVLRLQLAEEQAAIELALATLTDDELRRGLVQYCREPFVDLTEELSIERILVKQGKNMKELLQNLIKKSSPLLALNLAAQEDEDHPVEEQVYIASEFGEDWAWAGVMKPAGCTILKSQEPHRISVLTIKAKISPRTVVGYPSWRRAWQEKRAKGYPMQIYSDEDLDLREK